MYYVKEFEHPFPNIKATNGISTPLQNSLVDLMYPMWDINSSTNGSSSILNLM